MADVSLCIRNQLGYCKYKSVCQYRHENKVCENVVCENQKCDKRHPTECWWFKSYNRCKFRFCAYKHVKKSDPLDVLKQKIDDLEEKIKEKEDEIKLQEKKIKEIETKQNETLLESKVNDLAKKLHDKESEMNKKEKDLETKVINLERFVLKLQEKLEQTANWDCHAGKYDPKEAGWAIFDPLVRRPSLENKCEESDYVGRNSARLKTHIELKHLHICTECTENYRVGETIFKTKEEFLEHNKIVHENLDHILTEEEFDNLSSVNSYCLRNGQSDTPKSKDAEKKKDLRERSLRLKQKKLNI